MTPESFAGLVLGCAMGVKLLVDLRVPFAPLRRCAAGADHVVTLDDEDTGPFQARVGGEPVGEPSASFAAAAAHVARPQRLRAWLYEMVSCPYCCGGWVTLAAVAGWVAATGNGWAELVWWPAIWATTGIVVTRLMRRPPPA